MDELKKLLENAGVTENADTPMQGNYKLYVDTKGDTVSIVNDTGHPQGPSPVATFRTAVWEQLVADWHKQDDVFDPFDTGDDDRDHRHDMEDDMGAWDGQA